MSDIPTGNSIHEQRGRVMRMQAIRKEIAGLDWKRLSDEEKTAKRDELTRQLDEIEAIHKAAREPRTGWRRVRRNRK